MKNLKQFIAVFMTAVFLAGTFPVTLSAADTRDNGAMTSVDEEMAAAADTEQGEDTEPEDESVPEEGTEERACSSGPEDPEGDPADEVPETYWETDPELSAESAAEAAAAGAAEENLSGAEADAEGSAAQEEAASTEADTPEETLQIPVIKAPAEEETVSAPAVNAAEAAYTVTLNANGGGYYIDYSNNAHVQTVTHTGEPDGMDISVYQIPRANPGKIFAGWSTSANGTVLPTGTTVTKDLYLYAVWEQGCAVTLDANGGHFTSEDGT